MSKRNKTVRPPARTLGAKCSAYLSPELAAIDGLISEEKWYEAISRLELLERKSPMDPDVISRLMKSSFRALDYDVTERAAWKWQRILPDSQAALSALMLAHASNGHALLALRSIELLKKRWPDAADMTASIQQVSEMRREIEEQFAKRGMNTPRGWELAGDHEYATFLMASDQWSQSRRILESITTRAPEYTAAWVSLSQGFAFDGQYADAIRAGMRALENEPDNVEALASLVACQARLGNSEAARSLAARLKEALSSGTHSHASSAIALTLIQDYAGVLDVYELPRSPKDSDQLSALVSHLAAYAACRQGDIPRARHVWAIALDLEPRLGVATRNLADLDCPADARFGPVAMTFSQLVREGLSEAIMVVFDQLPTLSVDSQKRLCDRLMRRHGEELTAHAPMVYDLSDQNGIVIMLALTAATRDPALLAEARRFATGGHGTRDLRERALQILSETS